MAFSTSFIFRLTLRMHSLSEVSSDPFGFTSHDEKPSTVSSHGPKPSCLCKPAEQQTAGFRAPALMVSAPGGSYGSIMIIPCATGPRTAVQSDHAGISSSIGPTTSIMMLKRQIAIPIMHALETTSSPADRRDLSGHGALNTVVSAHTENKYEVCAG